MKFTKEAKRLLVVLLLVLALSVVWVSPALGATTADVSITFTLQAIAVSDNATTWACGTIAPSSTPATATSYVGVTNTSNVQTDITISVTSATWTTAGTAYTHAEDATPGEDTVGLKASKGTGAFDVVVKFSSPNYIYENCPATTNFDYELKLYAPTSTTEETPTEHTNTVRITAVSG